MVTFDNSIASDVQNMTPGGLTAQSQTVQHHVLAVEDSSSIIQIQRNGTGRHRRHRPIVSATQNGHTFNATTLNPSSNVSGSGVLTSASVILDVDPNESTPKSYVHYKGEAYEKDGDMGKQALDVAAQLLSFHNGNSGIKSNIDITEATTYRTTTYNNGSSIHYFQSSGNQYVMVSKFQSGQVQNPGYYIDLAEQ